MNGHHLILGELIDFLTGVKIRDTHDERYRQKIARFLVNEKGYSKKDIRSNLKLTVSAGENRAIVRIDFAVSALSKTGMIIKYGPGSIVTRHRPSLATSRLLEPYQIPVVVATNGETADILDGTTGRLMGQGFDAIPSKTDLDALSKRVSFALVSSKQVDMESRIVYAYEVEGSCPCDDTVCRL